ncbi:tyrosine-type recombinase/integrase [Chlorogloeopsis sp. ULAP01]|uniref:tyrosine-type recombinase/integrase n=1 Tax=Chlorogloeopsis sp. ULAP01 TaxID=3056483 RepID=UPI0025AB3471|nr:tyrosine-type recombinase/integrase [Chlorogloeopsis sp. ULAP01]MDM9382583.1 tyrosine-type recombinase/integrase [Chlorogloeopsis sp. ULAP01]
MEGGTTFKKASKGTVVVENFRNKLRLRWRFNRERYSLTLGLEDTAENRKLAEAKAKQIESDIAYERFDATLAKYKPQVTTKYASVYESRPTQPRMTVNQLFAAFIEHKTKTVSVRTIKQKYEVVGKYLASYFDSNKTAEFVNLENAEEFVASLQQSMSASTIKIYLCLLNACWEWGKTKQVTQYNPWKELQQQVKVAPKQPPKPFNKDEIKAIIEAFKKDPHYRHYANYVQFLLATGVRTGEAIGLQWKHISDDFSSIWIGESFTRGVRKSTKTNKARTIPVNKKLEELLKLIKPTNAQPDDLVFPSPEGKAIDDHNFCNRAWRRILEKAGVEYRKPYNTRHTFISHCLEQGMNPVTVASITGHDIETLYENYTGVVNSKPLLPEIF